MDIENIKTNRLLKLQEEIYSKLTATFTDKKQFSLLNTLIDVELELESRCNI
jgi:hypothetical protein